MDIRPVNEAQTKVCVTFENKLEEEIAAEAIQGDNPFPCHRFGLRRLLEFYGTQLEIIVKPDYPRDIVVNYRRLGDIANEVFRYTGENSERARTAQSMGERVVEYWSRSSLQEEVTG